VGACHSVNPELAEVCTNGRMLGKALATSLVTHGTQAPLVFIDKRLIDGHLLSGIFLT